MNASIYVICVGLVVSALDCQLRGRGSNALQDRTLDQDFCAICTPSQLSHDKYTLTACGRWENEMARERIGHLPSYAEIHTLKLLALHTRLCLFYFLFLSISALHGSLLLPK